MDGTSIKRLSQEDKRNQTPVDSILEKAESVAQRVLKSIQEVAGTTNCKGVQIARLRDFAVRDGCWIDNIEDFCTYEDRGSENEVYLSKDNRIVYKLNDFRYSDDNLAPFFERLKAQKYYFPDCAYTLTGFAENKNGKTCAVIKQPYIVSSREATNEEIDVELKRLGFEPQMGGEYYSNGIHDIFDASPNNVLVGIDGNLYFIDTIIYESDEGNVDIYRSQSPNYQ